MEAVITYLVFIIGVTSMIGLISSINKTSLLGDAERQSRLCANIDRKINIERARLLIYGWNFNLFSITGSRPISPKIQYDLIKYLERGSHAKLYRLLKDLPRGVLVLNAQDSPYGGYITNRTRHKRLAELLEQKRDGGILVRLRQTQYGTLYMKCG